MFKHHIIKGYNALLELNILGANRPVCLYSSVTLIKQKKHTFFNHRHTLIIYDVPIDVYNSVLTYNTHKIIASVCSAVGKISNDIIKRGVWSLIITQYR